MDNTNHQDFYFPTAFMQTIQIPAIFLDDSTMLQGQDSPLDFGNNQALKVEWFHNEYSLLSSNSQQWQNHPHILASSFPFNSASLTNTQNSMHLPPLESPHQTTFEEMSSPSSEVLNSCRAQPQHHPRKRARIEPSPHYTLDHVIQRLSSASRLPKLAFPEANNKKAVQPQTVVARQRRMMIREKLRVLEKMVPLGTSKLDTARMLETVIRYVKFMQAQVVALESMPPADPLVNQRLHDLVTSPNVQRKLASSDMCLGVHRKSSIYANFDHLFSPLRHFS